MGSGVGWEEYVWLPPKKFDNIYFVLDLQIADCFTKCSTESNKELDGYNFFFYYSNS
jgi:hypothetical protein